MSDSLLKSYSLTTFTPMGTVSRLDLLCDSGRFDRVILLKGGSRLSRAGVILSAKSAAESRSLSATLLTNADTARPEAVIFGRTALLDAAAPCPIEPKFPSALEEIFWLGEWQNNALLSRSLGELQSLDRQAKQREERAQRLLAAADSLLGDSRRMAREAIDEQKVVIQAKKAAKRLSGKGFEETVCLFSGCFSHGELCSAINRPKTVVALQDETGCCAPLFLRELYRQAKNAGCPVIAGYSPFAPYERLEQLILPRDNIGFFTENSRISSPFEPDRVIHSRRFTDRERLSAFKNRISLNKKAAKQLILSAKQIFDEEQALLEKADRIYDSALDEKAFSACRERLLASLF